MLKRLFLIVLILINVFLLSGCWNYIELDEQVNVSGLAVDEGQNGKKYHVSAEIITVGDDKESQVNKNILESDGDTIFEGIRNLINISSKKLYFGHCKIMLLCEKVCEDGISEILDLPIRNHEVRINTNIAISKGCSAKDILSAEGVETPIISYQINDLLKTTQQYIGEAPINIAYKIYNSILDNGVIIPALDLTKIEDEDSIEFCGAGVFKKDKMIGFLNVDETKSLSFIKDNIKRGLLTVQAEPNSYISFEIFDNKTEVKHNIKDDNFSINVTTNTSLNIGEYGEKTDYKNESVIEKARKNVEKNLENNLTNLINVAQKDLNYDMFGFDKQISEQDPKLWEKYKEKWDKMFKTININVDSKVEIIGSGITSETTEVKE